MPAAALPAVAFHQPSASPLYGIGVAVRVRRKAMRHSQAELAAGIGRDRSMVSRVERNLARLDVTMAIKIADYLGVSVATLIKESRNV